MNAQLILLLAAFVVAPPDSSSIAERLDAGDWQKAERLSAKLAKRQAHGLTGPSAARALAQTSALRGVAFERMGRLEDAHWYWHMALMLDATMAEATLAGYPQSRPLLAVPPREQHSEDDQETCIRPPRPLKQPDKVYPKASKRTRDEPAQVLVSAIVSEEGQATLPLLVHSNVDAPWIYFAFESVRGMPFDAGTRNGRPHPCGFLFNFQFID
ncbi:MAG: hypothetical protein AAF690_06920 [Acidobacteriota bacterium]